MGAEYPAQDCSPGAYPPVGDTRIGALISNHSPSPRFTLANITLLDSLRTVLLPVGPATTRCPDNISVPFLPPPGVHAIYGVCSSSRESGVCTRIPTSDGLPQFSPSSLYLISSHRIVHQKGACIRRGVLKDNEERLYSVEINIFASPPLPCLVGPDGRGRVAGSGMTFLPCRR